MATGDDINVTLTWPVKGSVSAYITRLTGIPEGLRIFNDDLNTTSRVVDCLVGFQYHQETYYVDDGGTHWLKSLDFVAGQPAPPPTDLEAIDLSTCLSSGRSIDITYSDYQVNSQYKDGTPVTGFNVNGIYTLTWNGSNWDIAPFVAWTDEGEDTLMTPNVNCSGGNYGIPSAGNIGNFPDFPGGPPISLGGSVTSTDPDDPAESPFTGGTISINPSPR